MVETVFNIDSGSEFADASTSGRDNRTRLPSIHQLTMSTTSYRKSLMSEEQQQQQEHHRHHHSHQPRDNFRGPFLHPGNGYSSHENSSQISQLPEEALMDYQETEQVASGKSRLPKRYFCKTCNQGFTRKHNMVSHELIHSSLKPHICTNCNKNFRRIHDLKRHEKLHTGEKPFSCEKCSRRFARPDALTRHRNSANACTGTIAPINDTTTTTGDVSVSSDLHRPALSTKQRLDDDPNGEPISSGSENNSSIFSNSGHSATSGSGHSIHSSRSDPTTVPTLQKLGISPTEGNTTGEQQQQQQQHGVVGRRNSIPQQLPHLSGVSVLAQHSIFPIPNHPFAQSNFYKSQSRPSLPIPYINGTTIHSGRVETLISQPAFSSNPASYSNNSRPQQNFSSSTIMVPSLSHVGSISNDKNLHTISLRSESNPGSSTNANATSGSMSGHVAAKALQKSPQASQSLLEVSLQPHTIANQSRGSTIGPITSSGDEGKSKSNPRRSNLQNSSEPRDYFSPIEAHESIARHSPSTLLVMNGNYEKNEAHPPSDLPHSQPQLQHHHHESSISNERPNNSDKPAANDSARKEENLIPASQYHSLVEYTQSLEHNLTRLQSRLHDMEQKTNLSTPESS
ncbi:uncharacterized protein LODBEIA_P14960 [Lodderomyces beijingensis]|uniref:C2H2-type domain-containing protein n=1 Tax=Lodderomyces beijingensis TaxID=1775926 RepID=A0ABP0ZGI4_9ASCO